MAQVCFLILPFFLFYNISILFFPLQATIFFLLCRWVIDPFAESWRLNGIKSSIVCFFSPHRQFRRRYSQLVNREILFYFWFRLRRVMRGSIESQVLSFQTDIVGKIMLQVFGMARFYQWAPLLFKLVVASSIICWFKKFENPLKNIQTNKLMRCSGFDSRQQGLSHYRLVRPSC